MKKENGLGTLSFLETIAERAPQIVFAFDIDARQFMYLNPSFELIWNRTRESIFAKPASLLDNIHPDDKAHARVFYQQLLDGAALRETEIRILHPNKSIKWLNITPMLIEQEAGRRLLAGFAEDKTTLKENQEYVKKFAAKKNSLLEILSHDLSGPLNNIQGLSSLLSKEMKAYKNPKLSKLVEMVAKTSERSVGMIREFVKQEFLEAVSVELVRERANLVGMVEQIIEQYKDAEKEIAKTFELTASPGEIFMEIDEYKFNQVINNLVSNAIKFTPDGGIIKIHIEEKEEDVLITVADNGIGIPIKYHEMLFDKFSRAKRPGLKGEPSLGLGMSLIKTIVEWHAGHIWFESQEGKGTTFYIQLPKA